MLQIHALGALSVHRADGRRLASAATQPRRLAVLAVVARAGPRGVSRERLIALLWPDADEETGRKALSQALYGLRSGLGVDALFVGVQELRLDPELATCDVTAFEAAIAARDLAGATALYGGPFLDGFRVPNAPDFDQWVERERDALRHRHDGLLERLARQAQERDDAPGAAGWWRRRASSDPLDARVALELMRALVAAGDPGGALQHARIYETLLAQELDLPADREVVAFAERLRAEAASAPRAVPASAAGPAPAPPTSVGHAEPDAPDTPDVPTPPTSIAAATPAPLPAALPAPREPARRRRRWMRAALLTGGLLTVAAVDRSLLTGGTAAPAADAYTLGASQRITFEAGLDVDPVVSPDDRLVAYAAGPEDAMRVYVRHRAGSGQGVAVSGGLGGSHRRPRWSPDGARLLFQAERGAWVVGALGGPPREVVPAPADTLTLVASPEWAPDGREIAYAVDDTILVRSVADGRVRTLAALPSAHSLAWSPDGRWIAAASGNPGFLYGAWPGQRLFVAVGNLAPSSIWLIPAAGGEPRRLTDGLALDTSPAWLDGGRTLVFVSGRAGTRDLYLLRLDADGTPAGEPRRLTTGLHAHSVSAAGDGRTLAYGVLDLSANVWALPITDALAAGAPLDVRAAVQITYGRQTIESPAVSPDGRWLAFDSNRAGQQDIYRLPLDGDPTAQPERLVDWPTDEFRPEWSPDGRTIAFYTIRDGARHTAVVPARGGEPRLIHPTSDIQSRSPDWAPDGRRLAFFAPIGAEYQLFASDRADDSTWTPPRRLARVRGDTPRWSPDGRTIVFFAEREVHIMPSSGDDAQSRLLIASGDRRLGGAQATFVRWAPDGRALYVRATDEGGAATFWWFPLDGGAPRLLARLDDGSRRALRGEFSTDGRRLFFALAERESDVWVLELERPEERREERPTR